MNGNTFYLAQVIKLVINLVNLVIPGNKLSVDCWSRFKFYKIVIRSSIKIMIRSNSKTKLLKIVKNFDKIGEKR